MMGETFFEKKASPKASSKKLLTVSVFEWR